jgi:uncharacterized protein (TIGR03435 family)
MRGGAESSDAQVTGPEWLSAERYDISATIPAGATEERFQAMPQRLLAERFNMSHRETRQLAGYELVAGGGEISMNWGSGEFAQEAALDSLFTTPKVVYFASASGSWITSMRRRGAARNAGTSSAGRASRRLC